MVTRKKPAYKARCPICNGARGVLLLQTIGGITVLAHKDCVKAMSPDYYTWWDERSRILAKNKLSFKKKSDTMDI